MRFTLKHLEYFVAAGETGSIKLASERISISQPSISSAISHLERELDVQLFVRHHAQGLSLTISGQRILRDAKLLLRQADRLYLIASELNDKIRGTLSIGCFVSLAPIVVPELGHSFMASHPDVQLSISEGDHEKLLSDLRHVEIELAMTYDLQIPNDIEFEPLARLSPRIMLAKDHPLADRKALKLQDLADQPIILLDLPHSREYFLSLFHEAGLSANICARSASQEVVRAMVANGYGFTIANVRPKSLTSLDGRELATVKLAGKNRPMTVGIATLRQERKPRILVAFEAHCRKMINDQDIPGMMSD